eukprot:GILI01031190.1.p1 GENE.GILI01031190.1~~GILI01031190.1.p1  ORF type:complete len:344 (+),score=93.40 GILI01031190.1:204-1235(+)
MLTATSRPATPVATRRWGNVSMDFITDLKPSGEFDSIVVFVDAFTKMAHFAPTSKTVSAAETADIFFKEVFRHHGLPDRLVTDRDPRFTSAFWKHLFKEKLKTKLAPSTAFHPQSDGQTEVANRILTQMLRSFVTANQEGWPELLHQVEFAYNDSISSSTGHTPFYLNSGDHPKSLLDCLQAPQDAAPPAPAALPQDRFVQHMRALVSKAVDAITDAQDTFAAQANKHRREVHFKITDEVLLSTENLRLDNHGPAKKLQPKWLGPFKIKEKISDVNYRLDLPPTMKIHNVFHVNLLRPYYPSDPNEFPGREVFQPGPVVSSEVARMALSNMGAPREPSRCCRP